MSKIAYIRVSSIDQNTDRQELALSKFKIDKIFYEKISGKNITRPQLKKMLDYIREGDVLYIESISRLARSTHDLLGLVQVLQEKSVGLVSLKENINTTTPQGRFVLTIFGALAELERESILERQKEGIAAAKEKGKKFGRPRVDLPSNFYKVIKLWRDKKITAVEAMKKLGLDRGTFYRRINEYKKNNWKNFEKSKYIEKKP